MIHRIRIDGYKSFDSVSVEFRSLTAITGYNAAGKSNLLGAINLLSQLATARSITDAFEKAKNEPIDAFFFAEEGIENMLQKEEVAIRFEVDVELTDAVRKRAEATMASYKLLKKKKSLNLSRFLRYKVSVIFNPNTGILKVGHEYLHGLVRDGTTGELVPDEMRMPFIDTIGEKIKVRSEQGRHITEYELGLPYTLLSRVWEPSIYPNMLVLRTLFSDLGIYCFQPELMREDSPLKEVARLSPVGEGLSAFYYTLRQKNPLQFYNLIRALGMLVPSVEELDVKLTSEGRLRMLVKEHGTWFPVRLISDGTLRILGILAVIASHPSGSIIILENPETGIYFSGLRLIGKILREAAQSRQIIFSTHSSQLVEEDIYTVQMKSKNTDKELYFLN